MNRLIVIVLLSGLFLVAVVSAFYFEENYEALVRYFFKLFNGDRIYFRMPKFILSFGIYSPVSFGIFCVLLSYLLYRQSKNTRALKLGLTILVFFIATMASSFLDSRMKIAECMACENGRIALTYNEINYDFHFIASLVLALIPLSLSLLIKQKDYLEDKNAVL